MLERDPKDNKVTFLSFEQDGFDVETLHDVAVLISTLGDLAATLSSYQHFGHTVYPVFRTNDHLSGGDIAEPGKW